MNTTINKRNARRHAIKRRARALLAQAQRKAFEQLTPEATRRLSLNDLVRMQACGCDGNCTCGMAEGVPVTLH